MFWKRLMHDFGVAKFVAPVPATVKLSVAIREGHALGFRETKSFTWCAIGTAYRYKTGRSLTDDTESGSDAITEVAHVFGVPRNLVYEASDMHFRGANRLTVADWLESQGY